MVFRAGVEYQIRSLLRSVFNARRELMSEALDLLVRRCDARLPRVAPSLWNEPLTLERWDDFTHGELVKPARRGDVMSVLARRVRNALSDPRCEKLELVVQCWLPDEDPLREVTIVTRDAVAAWWRDPSTYISWETGHGLFTPRGVDSERRALEQCVLDRERAWFRDESLDALEAQLSSEDEATRAAAMRAVGERLRERAAQLDAIAQAIEVREPDDDEPEDNEPVEGALEQEADTPRRRRAVAEARRELCAGFAKLLASLARGEVGLVDDFIQCERWTSMAELRGLSESNGLVIREHYGVPDLERALVEAEARDARAALDAVTPR
jgi:hypothetical protein